MVETISAEELRDRIDAGDQVTVVDTRDEESFENWHIPGAVHYRFRPGSELEVDDFRRETGLDSDTPIATVCAKGISSQDFSDQLEAAGYDAVRVVEGGMQGWSSVYDVVDVPTAGPVDIVQFQRRAKGCLSYLVADTEAGVAAVIDPTRHVERYESVAAERDVDVEHVFDTHVHADHISGGRQLAEDVGASYHLGEGAVERDVRYEFDPLERNEVVRVGSVDVKAVETPGHTTEMVSYLVDGEAILTGDTLFVDSVGRTELQFGAGDAERGARLLYQSIQGTVLTQPDDTAVLPGHFALNADGAGSITHGEPVSTTVGTVRTGLSLLQRDEAAFVEAVTRSLPEQPANYEAVIEVNTGRRRPDDESEAASLETGPNNCAATSD